MALKSKVCLFGVPFDGLPSKEALMIKHVYLKAKALGFQANKYNYMDPYDFFSANLPPKIYEKCHLYGKVPIPSWLQPKPQNTDANKLTLDNLNHFVKSGGCLTIANDVQKFIKKNILPGIPGMIGVDHSSTYGAISALTEYYGEELGLIVLDAHFDAVPMTLRHGLIEYAEETRLHNVAPNLFSQGEFSSFSSQGIGGWSTLNAGNFILHLLERNLIQPRNLIAVGITDYPSKAFGEIDDPRVKAYIDFFKALEKTGACLIPRSDLLKNGSKHSLEKALQELNVKHVYLSLDIDVGYLASVYACRFPSSSGLSISQIRDVFQSLANSFSNGLTLAGFDLMEVDIHKLGAKINGSHADQTSDVGRFFLELVGELV